MRKTLIALLLLLGSMSPAFGQLQLHFGGPGVSIGINLPLYPTLQRVPGYPVYWAPGVNYNYFFYDGLYWVYEGDEWYASSWYNGPWYVVDRFAVPDFILRVPVRYYRHPPAYFRNWRADAPPRWHEHWGPSWAERRSNWDRWDRRAAPRPAPLPSYQRQYSGPRYPRAEEQARIETQRYRYQPREPLARQHREERRAAAGPEPRAERRGQDRGRGPDDGRGTQERGYSGG